MDEVGLTVRLPRFVAGSSVSYRIRRGGDRSGEEGIVHRLQLLHTLMTALGWNVLLPFEVIKLILEYC